MESQPLSPQGVYYDYESQERYMDEKLERLTRHGFIRKVYGIVLSQLIVTSIVGAYFTLNEAAGKWIVTTGSPLVLTCGIVALVLCFALVCFPSVARHYPSNYVILGLFTVAEAIGLGGLCAVTSLRSGGFVVLAALICTVVVVSGLTAFAFQTKYDFTSWMPYVLVASLTLICFGLVYAFLPRNPVVDALYAAAMAALFSFYLLIDTQRIVGKANRDLPIDDYILIALTLYLDIINLFIYLLKLLEQLSGNRDR